MNVVEAIRRANEPRPPENSVRFRVACTGAVLTAIAASATEGEMAWSVAVLSMALVAFGMAFSYRTRHSPPGWVKLAVAVGAVSALVWFVDQVGGTRVTDITGVENPLTILFAWILVVHSFHVPARRDLVFALGGSAALMAVAAAQAIDMRYGLLVLVWSAFGLWGLTEHWAAASGGGRVRARGVTTAAFSVVGAAVAVFLVLPAPRVAVRVDFQANPGSAGPVTSPGALAGDSGSPVQLSRPGSPTGRARVGGYLGFAGSLDTALRGRLGHTLVMQVRADRPTFWVGETFDQWADNSWSSTSSRTLTLDQGSPFQIPELGPDQPSSLGGSDLQTFYVQTPTADLVFHADTARQVWFPAAKLYYGADGTIISPIGMGKGAIYTVESRVDTPDPAALRAAGDPAGSDPRLVAQYTQLSGDYTRARDLAESVTAGAPTAYDKVQALISWIGANTRYSTDIPTLPAGTDTVNEFLFGDRTGFCEQISTALAVMLRALGVPTREAVGYVPGSYNPITDLYQVRAEDAHAWVQVWFPGYGWQSFDPTAVVPDANPSPGATALSDAGRFLGGLPWAVLAPLACAALLLVVATRVVRSRPRTWAEAAAGRMERAGRRAGRPRGPGETILEYGTALDHASPGGGAGWSRLAQAIDEAAYGSRIPLATEGHSLVAAAERHRPDRRLVGATRRE